MQSGFRRHRALIALLCVAAVANFGAVKTASGRSYAIPPPTPLPAEVEGYRGERIPTLDSTKGILPHADITSFHYDKKDDLIPVDLVVIASRDPNDMHSPERCFSGFGFEILERSSLPLKVEGANSGEWTMSKMRVKDSGGEQLVLFLYDKVPKMGGTVWTRFFMKLAPNREPAYFVRLSAPVNGGDVNATQARLIQFASGIMQTRDRWQPPPTEKG